MSKAGDALADRILSELLELSALTDRIQRAWEMVLNPDKIKLLVENLPDTLMETEAALRAFADFLRNAD